MKRKGSHYMVYVPIIGNPRSNGKAKTSNNNGSRPDSSKMGKAAAQQHYDKYTAMAVGHVAADDRIAAEYCYQHAEHYWRLLSELKTLESGTEPVA